MSKAAARRAATAAAAARAVALLFVFALFASSLHLTPRLPFAMERLLAEQPAKPLNEAHQPSRSRAQLHHATASRQQQQQHQKAQDLLLSFPVCGDFANQRISLASGGHCLMPAAA